MRVIKHGLGQVDGLAVGRTDLLFVPPFSLTIGSSLHGEVTYHDCHRLEMYLFMKDGVETVAGYLYSAGKDFTDLHCSFEWLNGFVFAAHEELIQ